MNQFFKNYFGVLSVAIVLLTGCSAEQETVSPDDENTKGQISFSFPISKWTSLYSTVAATGYENYFTTDGMVIYMINNSNIIEGIFSGSGLIGSVSGTTQLVKISLFADVTTDKTFYFVANASSVTSALSAITVGSSLSDLLKVTTEVQSAHLSSADGLLLTGSVTVTADVLAAATPTPISVALKRRVARFDISNDAATSLVTIKKVLISDAKTTALAFADKDSLPKTRGNLPEIMFAADSKVNKGNTASVFYLYPSDSVVIQLLTDVAGEERLFKLPLPEGGIEANKSYTIKAKVTQSSFDLVIEEWTEGEEIEASCNGSVEIGVSVPEGQQEWWDADASTYDVSVKGTTITLTTSTLSSSGVTVEVLDAPDTGYSITTSIGTPTISYSGVSYKQNITIDIPPYTGATPLNAKVVIKDGSNLEQRKIIKVIRKDYYPPAHKGWAGCNIYYDTDKGHLTFDDVDSTRYSAYQGVYFKWGSLWGISPEGGWNGDVRLYPPAGDPISAKDRDTSFEWKKIVPFMDTLLLTPASGKDRRNWSYLYQITNGETGKGDICKWLTQKGWSPGSATGKKWRMPTSQEFDTKTDYTPNKVGDFVAQISDKADGTFLMNSGYSKGSNPATDPFFPVSGYRKTSGALQGAGTSGYVWSGSPGGQTHGHYMFLTGSNVGSNSNTYRTEGVPVRCVVE